MDKYQMTNFIINVSGQNNFTDAICKLDLESYKNNLIRSNCTATKISEAVMMYMEKNLGYLSIFNDNNKRVLYKLISERCTHDRNFINLNMKQKEELVKNQADNFTKKISDKFSKKHIQKIFLERLITISAKNKGSFDYYTKELNIDINNILEKDGFIKYLCKMEEEYNYVHGCPKNMAKSMENFYGDDKLKDTIVTFLENNKQDKFRVTESMLARKLKITRATLEYLLMKYDLIDKYKTNNRKNIANKLQPKFVETSNNVKQILIENRSFIDDLDIENYDVDTENKQYFIEGMRKLVIHKKIERNHKVIELAKREFLRKNGRLYCQVCGTDFYDRYGEIGKNYIEAHHRNPLNEINDKTKTEVKDILLVCSDCHSMFHRRMPCYSEDELREFLNIANSKKHLDMRHHYFNRILRWRDFNKVHSK